MTEPAQAVDDFDDAPTQPAGAPAEQQPTDDTDWKSEARKWEQRAKDNLKASKELERQQRAAMTDADRAVAEARDAGRTEALSVFGKRLARTEFDAAAARRNPGFDASSALEYVDLARFVGDDGEPDTKAIQAAVERLVPAATTGPPSFDGGPRGGTAATTDMNQFIRRSFGIG